MGASRHDLADAGAGSQRVLSRFATGSRTWGGLYILLCAVCTVGLLLGGEGQRALGWLMLCGVVVGTARWTCLRVVVDRRAVVARQWVGRREVPVTATLRVRTAPYQGGFHGGPGRSGRFWVVALVDEERETPLAVTITTWGRAWRKADRLGFALDEFRGSTAHADERRGLGPAGGRNGSPGQARVRDHVLRGGRGG